ncbi:DUF2058 family protein, partial [Pseudomonas aeruginosa]|uniref:DUF2058 family protein n=1 Tax=Pseudomonas aeruginosa TaxID=287 RepID=UPI001245BED7
IPGHDLVASVIADDSQAASAQLVADQVVDRDPRRVVLLNVQSQEPDEDDPYKDYVVPDDLMW